MNTFIYWPSQSCRQAFKQTSELREYVSTPKPFTIVEKMEEKTLTG